MLAKPRYSVQLDFYSSFEEQLSRQHPLYILANKIDWNIFEEAFATLYSEEGRPGKPIRLMVSLLMLKHIRNISDESVVEQWFENIYYQYSVRRNLMHVRPRVKPVNWCTSATGSCSRYRIYFQKKYSCQRKDGSEQHATTDTTEQEKNITYPTDNKFQPELL